MPGDLYVVISVKEHPKFKREHDDLFTELTLSFPEAVFGGDFDVPKLGGGTVRMKVPQGTQPGTVYRLRGEGFPKLNRRGAQGDLMVKVNIDVPKNLTDQQRNSLRDFARASGIKESETKSNIFKKVFG